MPDINKLTEAASSAAQTGNLSYIDPATGLEMIKPKKGKYVPAPTEESLNIASAVHQYKSSTPDTDYNFRPVLGDRSKYDVDIKPTELESLLTGEPEDFQTSLEDVRSQKQGSLPAFGNAVTKMLAKTGINAIGGLAGTIYGAVDAVAEGNITKLYDNAVINELDNWSKGLDKTMPVYKSSNYQSDNLLQNIIKNPIMFSDAASDAISFTAGAMLTAYIGGALSSSLRVANAVNQISKFNKGARFLEESAQIGTSINKASKALSVANKVDDVLGNARRIITGSAYEASVEANNMAQNMRQKAIPVIDKELNDKYSLLAQEAVARHPNAAENPMVKAAVDAELKYLKAQYDSERSKKLIDLETNVQKAGMGNYIANLAILGTSNSFQFGSTFGMRWSGARKTLSSSAAKFGEEVVEGTGEKLLKATAKNLPTTRLGKIASTAVTIAEKPFVEGIFEEGLQNVSSTATSDYYLRKYDPKNFGEARTYLESLGKSLVNTYDPSNIQAWKEIGMGMIIGGLGAPGKGLMPGHLGINEDTGERGPLWTGGALPWVKGSSYDERRGRRDNISRILSKYKEVGENTTLGMKAGINNVVADMEAIRNKEGSIKADDKKAFLDAQDDSYFGFVKARETAGVGSTIDDEVDSMKEMTPDGFIETYSGDKSDLIGMTAEQKKDYQDKTIDALEKRTAAIRKSLSLVNSIEPSDPINNYNPEIEDIKEQFAYLHSKGAFIDLRQDQLKEMLDVMTTGVIDGRTALQLEKDMALLGVNRSVVENLVSKKKKIETLEETIQRKEDELSSIRNTTNDRLKTNVDQRNKLDDELTGLRNELHTEKANLSKFIAKKGKSNREAVGNLTTPEARAEAKIADKLDHDAVVEYGKKIEKLEKDIANREKAISTFNKSISKLQGNIESLDKELKDTSTKLGEEINNYKKEYRDELNKRHSISKETANRRNVDFEFDNFDKYQEEILKVMDKDSEFQKNAQKYYASKPLEQEKISTALRDMGRLENSRQEAIELLNFLKTKQGRSLAVTKSKRAMYKLFEGIAVKAEEIKAEIEEILKNPRYLEGGIPYSFVRNGKEVVGKIGIHQETGQPIFIANSKDDVADEDYNDKGEVTKTYSAIYLEKLIALTKEENPKITDNKILSDAELSTKEEDAKLKKVGNINREAGTFTLPGETMEDSEGNEYFVVEKYTKDGTPYFVYYDINENGTIEPRILPEQDQPDYKTLKSISKEERTIDGDLVEYEDSKGNKEIGVLAYESPFLTEEEANDQSTYPKKLTFKPTSGTTAIIIEDKDTIKTLVDEAITAKSSKEVTVDSKTKNPIITFKGQQGSIEYRIKQAKKVPKWRKSKSGKRYNKPITLYFYPGETKFTTIELSPVAGKTLAEVEELARNGNLTSEDLTGLVGSREKASNYDIADIEVLQDDFVSKSGDKYVIFKKGDAIFAAKKNAKFYKIFTESNQLSNTARWGEIDLSKVKYFVDNNAEKELGETYDDTIKLSAQNPHLMFVAGREVDFIEVKLPSGNIFYENKRNPDGSLVINDNKSQQHWYNFLKTRFEGNEEKAKEFMDNHVLKIVVNNSEENSKYFQEDKEPKIGINPDGTISLPMSKDVAIKVVIVDKNTLEPITDEEGNQLFNAIHSPNFTNFDSTSKEAKEFYIEELNQLRNLIIAKINEDSTHSPTLLLPIVNVTTGRAVYEESIVTERGKERARFNVKGRLVSSNIDSATIPWDVVTSQKDATDDAIGATIIINSVEYKFSKKSKSVGQVISAIVGANGQAIPVTLLTRNVNDEEATTVAALLKMVAEGKNEFEGIPIIPEGKQSIKDTEFYLKRFIKYGKNSGKNTDTQLYYDAKTKSIIIGKDSISLEQLNTSEGFEALVNKLKERKILHISKSFKGKPFNVSYTDKDGNIVKTLSYNHYNEYLFGDKDSKGNFTLKPVLQTDLAEMVDGRNPVVQVGMEYRDLHTSIKDAPIFTKKTYSGPESKRTSSKKAEATTTKAAGDPNAPAALNQAFLDYADEAEAFANGTSVAAATEALAPVEVTTEDTSEMPVSNLPLEALLGTKEEIKTGKVENDDEATRLVSLSGTTNVQVEDLVEVRDWFNKNLPNIPLEIVDKIIATARGGAWGTFTGKAVKLYNLAEIGTAFHEAFHAVYRIGLSKSQQRALINAVRAEKGRGISISEVEELLAEDFRNWMLTGKSEYSTPSPVKRTVFQAIQDFIDTILDFFTGTNGFKNTVELYSRINSGGYSHIRATNEEITKDNWKLRQITGLDVTETEDLITGLSVRIIKNLYSDYNSDFTTFSKNIATIIAKEINTFIENSDTIPSAKRDRIVSTVKENYKEVITSIKDHFNYIGLSIDMEAGEESNTLVEDLTQEENKAGRGQEYNDSIEVSNIKSMSNEIKLLIHTLYERVPMGEGKSAEKLNSVGLPTIVDFATTYNTLLETLNGTTNWDGENGIMAKLEKLAKEKSEIRLLINRINALRGDRGVVVRNKFRQAFSINRYGFKTYVIGEEGGKFINSSTSRNIDRLREQLDSEYKNSSLYKEALHEGATKTNKKILTEISELKKMDMNNPAFRIRFANLMRGLGFDNVMDLGALINNKVVISDLLTALSENNTFASTNLVSDLTTLKSGRFKKVLMHEAINRKNYFEPQHANPENKLVHEYSLNNYYSSIINVLNNAKNLSIAEERIQEVYDKLPQMRNLEGKSIWWTKVINGLKDGSLDLNITFLEGMRENVSGTEGRVTYDLSQTDLAKMHVEGLLVAGLSTFRRPSDKSLEPAIEGFGIEVKPDNFRLKQILIGYLEHDLKTTNGKDLQMLKSIFSEELVKDIILNKGKLELIGDRILNEFRGYLAEEASSLNKLFTDLKLINGNSNIFSEELNKLYSNNADIIDAFALNYFISRIEQHMMFLGDFSQFKQLFKRTSGPTGTGKTFSQDAHTVEMIQKGYIEHLSKMSLEDRYKRLDLVLQLTVPQREALGIVDEKVLNLPVTINSTNIAVLKERVERISAEQRAWFEKLIREDATNSGLSESQLDVLVEQYMKPYNNMEIADGLGYTSLEKYRHFLIATGDWNMDIQEPVYQKIVNGESLTANDVAVFPPIKPQGFGPKAFKIIFGEDGPVEQDLSDENFKLAFEKLSIIPLIRTATNGKEIGVLSDSMQQSGVDVAIYQSGLKDNTTNSEDIVDFQGESIQMNSFNQNLKYWKIQLDIHPEIEEEDTDGTQQRVGIFTDLFDGGQPVDFSGEGWTELSTQEREDASPLYKMFNEYSNTYDKIISDSKERFLKDSGLVLSDEGEYIIKDYEKFAATIRKEISSRRLPSNILKAVTVDKETGKLKFPIDALPIADKIENMLFARAMNNTVRIKRPGAAYIQTSNALWLDSDTSKAEAFAKRLSFVRNDKGKVTGAEVYLPNYMRSVIGDVSEVELAQLMKSKPELFKLMGYRIPTQGQNSMLPLIVKGFLPAEMGDTVIVPYEIVAQSGADFDIDKLHIFRPNFIKVGKDVRYISQDMTVEDLKEELKLIEQSIPKITPLPGEKISSVIENNLSLALMGITLEELIQERDDIKSYLGRKLELMKLQNRLLEIQLELLTHPASARNLIVPNGAEFLKEEAAFTEYLKELGKAGVIVDISKVTKESSDFKNWLPTYNKAQSTTQDRNLLSYQYELETGMAFKGGKKGVAIAATYAKFHNLSQQSGLTLSGRMKVKEVSVEETGNSVAYPEPGKPMILKFEHNTVNKEGVVLTSLGNKFAKGGRLISEQFNEHLTANVDIAKDPFIFKLNTNGITSNVKYFMIAVGANPEFANRFLTQPIIEEYIKERLKNESISVQATKSDGKDSIYESEIVILNNLYEKYNGTGSSNVEKTLDDIHNRVGGNITIEQLNNGILKGASNKQDNKDKAFQLQVLADFKAYLDYGKAFSDGVQAVKSDTKRLKNHSETITLLDNISEVEKVGLFSNIKKALNRGILKGFTSSHAEFVKNLYKQVFLTQSNGIQEKIYKVIKNDIAIGRAKLSDKEVDKIRQSVMTYLLQVAVSKALYNTKGVPFTYDLVKKTLVGDQSAPRKTHELSKNKNLVVDIFRSFLYTRAGDTTQNVDTIKVNGKKLDPFTADKIADQFSTVNDSAKAIFDELLAVTAMQTGTMYSPINFLKHMDSEAIGKILAPIIKQALENPVVNTFNLSSDTYENFLDNFYRANRKNTTFVPRIRGLKYATLSKDGNILSLDKESMYYGRRMLRRVEKSKDKDGNVKFTDILYKYEGFTGDEAIYVKTNVKSTFFLQEYHSGSTSVDITNIEKSNFIANEDRTKIIDAFVKDGMTVPVYDEISELKETTTEAPIGETVESVYSEHQGNMGTTTLDEVKEMEILFGTKETIEYIKKCK